MQSFKTSFGCEVSIINNKLNFIDENNIQQSIPLLTIKTVEDNIMQHPQNPEVLSHNRKIIVSALKGLIAFLGIIIIYKFINPEVVEKFRGGGRYLVEETSYITPIFLLIIAIIFFVVLVIVKKVIEKSDSLYQDDLHNKKDWVLNIKAEINSTLMPFQVCKGHSSEIKQIKQAIQS